MLHVREGVRDLLCAERTPAPVAPLLILGQVDAQLVQQQIGKTDATDPEHLRGGVRVEDASERQPPFALQRRHVVFRRVHDDLPLRVAKEGLQGSQADGEHVDRVVRARRRDLHQAHLLDVGVKTVRLRVERDARLGRHGVGDALERRGIRNQKLLALKNQQLAELEKH